MMTYNSLVASLVMSCDGIDPEDVAQAVKFSAWDSNIQLTFAFVVNCLLLVMGVAVFKSGAVKDRSFLLRFVPGIV